MACDIVLTVYNNLELTKNCLKSIFKYFRSGDRLIIVDNASNEETEDFLKRTKENSKDFDIELVRLYPNQGFIKAANTGLRKSSNEFVCLISNDTVVTEGWLGKMCNALTGHPEIGVINPSSNTFGIHPSKGQAIEDLALSLDKYRGQYRLTSGCVGFCMLIRKKLIDKIGYLDETYQGGYFEDTDYSRKVQEAGFKCAIAQDSYVWHKEHSTFKSAQIEELFKRNREIFHKRWGIPLRILVSLREKTQDGAINFCLRLANKGNWLWVVSSIPTARL